MSRRGGNRWNQQALMRHMRKLARRAGLNPHASVVATVTALAGRSLNKDDAYSWLEIDLDKEAPAAVRMPPTPTTSEQQKEHRAALRRARDEIERSDGWREVRYRVLRQSGGCCALCGRSKRLHGVILHVDHIKPKSRYPELAFDPTNLQVLCEDCNTGKSNMDDTDWRPPQGGSMAVRL